jgi:hypothetical protein
MSRAHLATEAGQYCNAGYLYSIRHILLTQNIIIFWLCGAVCESNLLPYKVFCVPSSLANCKVRNVAYIELIRHALRGLTYKNTV